MGWFWADSEPPRREASALRSARHYPPDHPPASSSVPTETPPPSCPMHKNSPLDHGSSAYSSKLNPFNLMPNLPQTAAPGQAVRLPTQRTVSSIPKGTSAADGHWEYPSPQQMYHAMVRKGYQESSPEEIQAIENMVAVHNFLNEGAWQEILAWERTFANGIFPYLKSPLNPEHQSTAQLGMQPRLLRFQGRSQDLTPKARILQLLAIVYPSKFSSDPPFDRHDWYIVRSRPNPDPSQPAIMKEVRYVIDYYSGPPEPTGEPVFYLDVRPALDSPEAALERAAKWGKEVWDKASGAEVRERERVKAEMEKAWANSK